MRKLLTLLCVVALFAVKAFAAPTITNVLVVAETSTTAQIIWNTSTPSNSTLKYGTDPTMPYENVTNPALVTSHSMTLTLLNAGPLYYVAAISTDNSGTSTSSPITFSLCGSPLTPVAGTVNNYYQYGSYTLTWVPPAGASQSPTVCGQPVTTTVTGALDGGASFNTQVADASKVLPGPGNWQVSVTDAGNIAPVAIVAYLSQYTQNVSAPLQAAAASGGLSACITNTNTSATYPSTCGGQGSAPGGTLGALQQNNGSGGFEGTIVNGIVKANGTGPVSAAAGSYGGSGDYQLPITVAGAGGGLSCALVGTVWTCTLAGGGLTGAVSPGNANQTVCYPTGASPGGTTVGPCSNIYALDVAMNQSQINALLSSLSGSNTYFIPAGAPQIGYTNPSGQVPHSFRLGDDWFQMPGIARDGKQSALTIQITQGSNTSNVGALLSVGDIGKTFFFFNRSGYTYGSTQSFWPATLTAYNPSTFIATWSANAPFTANSQVYYGTDNLASVETALAQASSLFPLTIPTGAGILVNGTIPWSGSQVIVGRHKAAGGFIGPPGQDVIATTDTPGQSISSPGTGLKGFYVIPSTEIDWTLGYNSYSANGTLTVVPPVYRPSHLHTPLAPDPVAPGFITGGSNGVATIAQNSAVICVPNVETPPAVGEKIMFPYFTSIFTSTVSSTAGSCSSGLTARTMAAAFPNTSAYTAAQAEWFAGSAIQSTTTTIPTTITYPLTLTLTLSTNPVPGWPSNFPQHGTVKVCGIEAEYMGITATTMVLRRGPASSAGCTGTTPLAPVNMCRAANLLGSSSDQPWPVIPSINVSATTAWSITSNVVTFTGTNPFHVGEVVYLSQFGGAASFFNNNAITILSTGLSGTQFEANFTHANGSGTDTGRAGDSTPSGANFFPGECGGNAGVAFPQANGNIYAGTGLSGGFLSDIDFIGSAAPGSNSGNANNTAAIYVAGNNAPFGSHFEDLVASNLQYDWLEGPASSGQHGVASVGPTGFGNTFHNLWFFGAFPLTFADMQGSDITEINMNSTEISPFDGTAIGTATCLTEWYTLDEQTGAVATSVGYVTHKTYGCEPEHGSNSEVLPAVAIAGTHISFDTANFEGIPNVFAGDHLKLTNTWLGLPTIDYGESNDFGTVDGSNAGYPTNTWNGFPQFLEWGQNGQCMAYLGSVGPPQACGTSTVPGYGGRGIGPSLTGSKAYYELGGRITPWMWDNNGAFDTNPMTTTGTTDATASYWGASATCALGGGALCQTDHFAQNVAGFLYIGPFGQLYDGPYILDASFKTLSAASSFTLNIEAADSGSLQCASGTTPVSIWSGTVSTTTSFTPFHNPAGSTIDFTGHAGCVLLVQMLAGSTTDTVAVDRFNLIPAPQTIWLPTANPTIGASCSGPNAIIGSNSVTPLFCLNGLVVAGGSGSGGISSLTNDVTATGSGAVAAHVVAIGGGPTFASQGSGPECNTTGSGQFNLCTNIQVAGFGLFGSYVRSGANIVPCTNTPVFDLSLGDVQILTLSSGCSAVSSSTVANVPSALSNIVQRITTIICQDGTGGRPFPTPTWVQGWTPVQQVASGCTTEMLTVANGTITADNNNSENCISSASPAVCDQATGGEIAIPAGTNPTLQINTTAWGAHSQLIFNPDATKAADLGITCNTTGPAGQYAVTGGSAGVDVVMTWYGTISTNPLCGTYTIRNP